LFNFSKNSFDGSSSFFLDDKQSYGHKQLKILFLISGEFTGVAIVSRVNCSLRLNGEGEKIGKCVME
jgi:hypothetical protein